MKPKGIIFDYDYTLGDSTKGIVICANEALSRLGWQPLATGQIQKTIGMSLTETYRVLTDDRDPGHAKDYQTYFRERAQEVMAPSASFYPGVAQMLQTLSAQGWLLGIVTSKQGLQIDKILRLHKLREYFDKVLGGDDVAREKPDPEGLLKIAACWQLAPAELLYIGDSVIDAKAAQNAGAAFAAVTTGVTPKDAFAPFPCRAVFEGLEELIPFLKEL